MSTRIQKTFEALFQLEEVRGLFRESLPTGLDSEEETVFRQRIADLKAIIADLEAGTGTSKVTKIAGTIDLRTREEEYINIQPIQAAGRLTTEARKALISYGDGYSTCDACRKPFRLDKISKPGIAEFHRELAKFVNMDHARVVPGARRGFQAVTGTLVNRGDSVIVSALAHYTEFLAVESAGGVVKEVPLNKKNIVTGDAMAEKIEEVRQETGKLPVLVMISSQMNTKLKISEKLHTSMTYRSFTTEHIRWVYCRSMGRRSGRTLWSAPDIRVWHRSHRPGYWQ